MKRYLNQYLWVVVAVLLVVAALFVPQGWFAMRDAASLNRTHGEELSPLMVAQLDRSYERNIHERMTAYMEAAIGQGDVICSSKEIDSGSESLWENIGQTEDSLLMAMLRDNEFVLNLAMDIESCTQYVLMRQSDGQILLVANDIRLVKENDCHMELLLDGVDGTIYYLESEEDNFVPLFGKWMGDYSAWMWWWMLNDVYHTEETLLRNEEAFSVDDEGNTSVNLNINKASEHAGIYESYIMSLHDKLPSSERDVMDTSQVRIFNDGNSYPGIWVSSSLNKDIYCCLLPFGEVSDSWTMEIEAQDEGAFSYRIRLGLSSVVKYIPEIAERISMAEYYYIYE